MGLSMWTEGMQTDPGRRIDPASVGLMPVMQPSQITRGLAFRRYAYGKPVQQIADETGLRYDQILSVLKGEPFNIEVAARLTGYLRTPCAREFKGKIHHERGECSETRRGLYKRLARMRAIARHFKKRVGFAKTEKLSAFSDGELRAYLHNAEDAVKEEILNLYPTISDHWKLSDDMAPWEYLERIDRLKMDPAARDAVARSRVVSQAQARRAAAA